MNNDLNGRTAVAAARRRLIRGAFAAPAALTLYSGSVYATTSNAQCLANAIENNSPLDAPPNPDGTWLRVEVRKLGAGDKMSTWVWGGDLKFVRASGTADPYLPEAHWQNLTAGKESGFKNVAKQVVTSTPTKWGKTPEWDRSSYVAVRVDATGKIIGIQGIETGGTATSLFCWESFVASA